MDNPLKAWFNWQPCRDSNYYYGLGLLVLGILTLVGYLIFDLFEPIAFLITFLIVSWGFVLLWKSDNDLRFQKTQAKMAQLQEELDFIKKII